MAKFAIGDRVEATRDHKDGVVVAVFSTVDGNFRYAIDVEGYGALQFVTEETLVFYHADQQALDDAGMNRQGAARPKSREGASHR
jgi:hypothetical protein